MLWLTPPTSAKAKCCRQRPVTSRNSHISAAVLSFRPTQPSQVLLPSMAPHQVIPSSHHCMDQVEGLRSGGCTPAFLALFTCLHGPSRRPSRRWWPLAQSSPLFISLVPCLRVDGSGRRWDASTVSPQQRWPECSGSYTEATPALRRAHCECACREADKGSRPSGAIQILRVYATTCRMPWVFTGTVMPVRQPVWG